MSLEGQLLDQKSLRAVTGKTADWNEIAKDCIAFANATGGHLLLGIEDGPSERSALPWETQTTLHVPRTEIDPAKRDKLLAALRASDRVKPSVKEKSDDELLDHYQLAQGPEPHQSGRAQSRSPASSRSTDHRSGHPVHQVRRARTEGQQAGLGRPHAKPDGIDRSGLAGGA